MSDASVSGLTRSVLFAPGNHVRKAEKALLSNADAVVLDLEDSVPVTEKTAARMLVAAALSRPRKCRAYVRINGLTNKDWELDLEAVISAGLDGIVVPKAERAADLQRLGARLDVFERRIGLAPGSLELMPIVENARGVWDCEALAAATPRVRRLIFGGADYTLDLDLEWSMEEHELSFARAHLTHASRLAGIEPPVDTAILQVRDAERFVQSARNGRRMGFQGKLCLHPHQINLCHGVFAPSLAEIEHARSVVAAFDAAQARGTAAIELNGYFIDLPVVLKARRVLAMAAQRPESQAFPADAESSF